MTASIFPLRRTSPPRRPSVVYVLPDKMGGLLNIVANLLEYRRPDTFSHQVVLTHNPLSTDTRFGGTFMADTQRTVEYSLPLENMYAVTRRLARAVPRGPGVLVSNDILELAMLETHDLGRTVIQILHGDHGYYYDLARTHEPFIHAWIAYSRRMYDRLRAVLPAPRHEHVFYLPYGIPLPARVRQPAAGPIRILFAGRLEHGQKGVLDLPDIDRRLRDLGVHAAWTIVGGGPDEQRLRSRWTGRGVRWLGVRANAEVIDLCASHDVFILPTRTEGFPVALIEAMGAGLVPVVSDISSGVPEIVDAASGLRVPPGDLDGFAAALADLHRDRDRLEAMSRAARQRVEERFDIRERVGAYQDLYARWRELYRERPRDLTPHYRTRLDRPWIPNVAVYAVRRTRRWLIYG